MHEVEIARGALVLDAYDPTWRERVDPDQLDTASIRWCVVGQALGVAGHTPYLDVDPDPDDDRQLGWHEALDRLGAPPGVGGWSSPARDEWTVQHGFEAPETNRFRDRDHSTLTHEWRLYLRGELVMRRTETELRA